MPTYHVTYVTNSNQIPLNPANDWYSITPIPARRRDGSHEYRVQYTTHRSLENLTLQNDVGGRKRIQYPTIS